jgi:hypothetical protein
MEDSDGEDFDDYSSEDPDDHTLFYNNLARQRNLRLNNSPHTMNWILNDIDNFIGQTRDNESVENVHFYPHLVDGHQDDDAWEKFGHAIGNFQALTSLHIRTPNYRDADDDSDDDDDDDGVFVVPIPDWEVLARVLSHVRQSITLTVTIDDVHAVAWRVADSRSLARAIHGHPTITGFEAGDKFPYEALDALYSALATLPTLTSITLSYCGYHTRMEDESASAHHESLTKLLRLSCLRSVCFASFFFTRALCQATSNALMEGTAVTKLQFRECEFSTGECAIIMASGISGNTSVLSIEVAYPVDEALSCALAMALPSNSTLQELSLEVPDDPGAHMYWSPILLALGNNTGLKSLSLDGLGSMEGSLCTAMQNGLTLNETLESLQLHNVHLCDSEFAFWCRAFSFLRTNSALMSLTLNSIEDDATQSCISAFCFDIAAMLEENASLEVLSIQSWKTAEFCAKDYLALIPALNGNQSLKILGFAEYASLQFTADEDKQMGALLRKNYGLESLPDFEWNPNNGAGDVGAILRLNAAGRRYLIEDGSSISKGVDVLSRVNDDDDINCVFLHLLENPRLCDRSAVEAPDADESNSSSTSPTARSRSGGGKREQAIGDKGKESRRRLA